MSTKYLRTDTLDIHAGGRDLIFPHHENEIAQSEALTGKPLAKYWMHHGLLTINGQKMSKSQGNFVSIKDFISKYRYAEILKLFFLSCHYGHPIDYNEDRIEESKQALERILILLSKIDSQLLTFNPKLSTGEIAEIENIKQEFIQAMDDDFNMPEAQASIFTLINLTHKNINDLTFIYNAREAIKELLDIFGISLPPQKLITDITDDEIRERIRERDKVRQAKDYPLADEIRRELEEKGIILEDGESKTTWRRRL